MFETRPLGVSRAADRQAPGEAGSSRTRPRSPGQVLDPVARDPLADELAARSGAPAGAAQGEQTADYGAGDRSSRRARAIRS